MAISLVGALGGTVGGAADTTVNFTSLKDESGAAISGLLQGDLVIVTLCQRNTANTNPALTTTGYTDIYSNIYVNSTDDCNLVSRYKFMGATPDTSVVITVAPAGTTEAYSITALRGVDQTTPLDGVAVVTSNAIGIAAPDGGAITPATSGAWIMVAGGAVGPASGSVLSALTNPTNMDSTTNHFVTGTNTRGEAAHAIYSAWTSGSFNPAAFGGGSNSSTGTVAAATWVLRPASTSGTTYNDTLSESVTAGDGYAQAMTFALTLSESATMADSLASAAVFNSALAESVTAGDSASAGNVISTTLAEGITSGDSVSYALTMNASLNSAVTLGYAVSDGSASTGARVTVFFLT